MFWTTNETKIQQHFITLYQKQNRSYYICILNKVIFYIGDVLQSSILYIKGFWEK